jgi:periplasmic protein TonB
VNRLADRSGFEADAGAKGRFELLIEAPRREYAASLLLAIGIHASILFWWPRDLLFEPAEYGVVRGESAMEVALVAASRPLEDEPIESHAPIEPQEVAQLQGAAELHEPIAENEDRSLTPAPMPAADAVQEVTPSEQVVDAKPRPTPSGAPVRSSPKRKTASIARNALSSGGRNSEGSGSHSSTAGLTSGSLTVKAAYLFNPHPPYPEQSRRAGHTGLVILRVSINEHGRVSAVRVVKSSGYSLLDDRARTTLQRWVFKPARHGGRPVATQVDVPIRFSLNR